MSKKSRRAAKPSTPVSPQVPIRLDADTEKELQRSLRAEASLREAALDLIQPLNWGYTARDLSFAVSDSAGIPGYMGIHPPYYQDNTKAGECLPIYRSEPELKLIRDRMRILAAGNEFCRGAIDSRINYIVGCGFQYTAVPVDPRNREHRASAEKVRNVIEHWQDLNDLSEMEGESLARADIDGEFFIRRFTDADGWDHLRFVEPELVKSPNGSASDREYSFGIVTPKEDVVRVLGYTIVDNPLDDQSPNEVSADEVVHFTLNANASCKRGLPTFWPVEPNLKRCEELLASMSYMAKARAKIALIRKIPGLTPTSASQMVDALTTARATDPTTGQTQNIEQLRYGTILTTSAENGYEMPSLQVGAADLVEVLQAELRAVATLLSMPEWMFTAKADAKFDNAFISEGPTLKAFSRLQSRLCDVFGNKKRGPRTSLLWRQLRQAVEKGRLTEQDLAVTTISCVGPSLEARDRTAEVNRHKEMVASGLESVESAQRALELDPEIEGPLLAQDATTKPRPVTDLAVISQVQQSYYTGTLPREAALASLVVVLGIDQSRAESLLPKKQPETAPSSPQPATQTEPDPEPQREQSPLSATTVREQEEYSYSSTHVLLAPDLSEKVLSLSKRIPDDALADDGRETEPHITVLYGLLGDDPSGVQSLVQGVGPVRYSLGPVSIFPGADRGKDYDVVKIDVESDDLHGLHELLSELPHDKLHPEYRPHVTLAYVKAGLGAELANQLESPRASGTATELVFSDTASQKTIIPLLDSVAVTEAYDENDHPRDTDGQFSSGSGGGGKSSDSDDEKDHSETHSKWEQEDSQVEAKREKERDTRDRQFDRQRDRERGKAESKVTQTRGREDSKTQSLRDRRDTKREQDRSDEDSDRADDREKADQKEIKKLQKEYDRKKNKEADAIEANHQAELKKNPENKDAIDTKYQELYDANSEKWDNAYDAEEAEYLEHQERLYAEEDKDIESAREEEDAQIAAQDQAEDERVQAQRDQEDKDFDSKWEEETETLRDRMHEPFEAEYEKQDRERYQSRKNSSSDAHNSYYDTDADKKYSGD